ncbi:PA3496 family putative envelope integrity protein [Agarivorans sp. QJM3NY_25]|uniref:PA3496 family putative envelope integrity protein n=1 Tax=Agarivorans sp. QJM3NY_25 TaxID=3421430 RepID=UPI003D7D479A
MTQPSFDDMDEWDELDLLHNAKSHKTQRDKAKARRRIDEYHERRQLQRHLDQDYDDDY